MKLIKRSRVFGLTLTIILGGAFAGCNNNNPAGPTPPPPPGSNNVLKGTIMANETMTLDASIEYLIQGTVIVEDGGRLVIPAGTTLKGDVAFTGSALIVRQGGRLEAVGSPTAPIVFTSSNPPGSRRRGDWGGVVLNGRSLCNFPAAQCIGEGNSGPYGGNVLDDDSGHLSYVRIEYAGFEVSFGNELNGLTLNGVGSGTQLDHIQSHFGLDDGIELFGGTVDLKYAIVTGASDDSFDYSTGWEGRGQFWIAQQDPNDGDNGFEIDGNEENFDAMPLTDPLIYNVTLVGKEAGTGSAGESTRGILFRRGTAGQTYNTVVLGFETGVDVDNVETVGRVELHNSYVFGQQVSTFENDADGIDEAAYVMTAGWNNVPGVDPMLADPFNRVAPDFRPRAGSPLLANFASPPMDGFFDAVSYVGGVDPTGTPWYEGWITTDVN